MNRRPPLPIDDILPALVEQLAQHSALVIEAPPGAGKTTRVPLALLDAGFASDGEVWVTEPRRVAARLAAGHVARELGCELGGRVGYSVRFEERTGPETRLRFVTEGVLSRRLVRSAAELPARVVVLDEFHERHVATDLNLLLLRQRLARDPALRLVIMSATLDGESVAAYLGGCPVLRCSGRTYPLSIEHEAPGDDRPLELRVSSAVKRVVRSSPDGGVLVFLPGAAEIRKAEARLADFARQHDLALSTLHGEMPLEAQAQTLAANSRRKVVLSTNVAESSVTVEGISTVVDSGLARIAMHSPWTGRQSLEVRPIAQASATQRAGRAGRTRPGHVVRLYSEADLRARPAYEKPEITRLDLAEALLSAYGAGLAPEPGDWLSPPSSAVQASADRLLERLGLIEGRGLTPLGRRALALPVTPRLARVVLEGERLGIVDTACLAAALLGERDLRAAPQARAGEALLGCECDVDHAIELFRMARGERFSAQALRRLGLHPARVAAVRAADQQIRRELAQTRPRAGAPPEPTTPRGQQALSLALLAGHPDRVARRQKPGGRELILASGDVAELAEESLVRGGQLLLAVEAEERSSGLPGERGARRGRPTLRVRVAAPLEAEWLLDHAAHAIEDREELVWDDTRQRAIVSSQLCWGAVVLERGERAAAPSDASAALVERAALAQRANLFGKSDALASLFARAELLAEHMPDGDFGAVTGLGQRGLLGRACRHVTSLEELRALDFRELFLAELGAAQRALLEREAPEWFQLPSGRRARVQYGSGQPPFIAARLQDFFGMREGPRVCRGRVPLTLHLLAPNQRAVQVTTDLAGFWQRHYPALRRELCRRYPKHAWPEDGSVAPARTKPTERR